MGVIHIAIDPGKGGGIAWAESRESAACASMPDTRRDLITLFSDIVCGSPSRCVAYIEKISGFIPDGGPSRLFEFGRQVERPGAILETLGVRIVEVTPQTWQKALNLGNSERQRPPQAPRMPPAPRGSSPGQKLQWKRQHKPAHDAAVAEFKKLHAEEIKSIKSANSRAKTDWKQKLKSEAQRRFPSLDLTLASADAALILDYSLQHIAYSFLQSPQ